MRETWSTLVEDAAEAMGATWSGKECGSYGDYAAVSYNGNKIITGSAGGCLLTDSLEDANQARKWSTQAREAAAWYQNEEVGYNYRMSNVIAGVIRDQYHHLSDHIAQKKAIYERYKEGFKDLPVQMNPFDETKAEPNYWLSSMIIDEEAMCKQVRSDTEALYVAEPGKSCPTEILEAISSINAEGRPIWKPMHMQPMYRMHEFVTVNGSGRAKTNAYIAGGIKDVGADIFQRGVCLPSDNKMTAEQQDRIIDVIRLVLSKKRSLFMFKGKAGIYNKFFKRIIDIICALFAIGVFWWLYIIVAVLVRVKLGSPVIFKQARPGKINPKTGKEDIFYLYKLDL